MPLRPPSFFSITLDAVSGPTPLLASAITAFFSLRMHYTRVSINSLYPFLFFRGNLNLFLPVFLTRLISSSSQGLRAAIILDSQTGQTISSGTFFTCRREVHFLQFVQNRTILSFIMRSLSASTIDRSAFSGATRSFFHGKTG